MLSRIRIHHALWGMFSMVVAATISCGSNSDAGPQDLGGIDLAPDIWLAPDYAVVDEPFGRSCTKEEFGKECKDKDADNNPLTCVPVEKDSEKGLCTKPCSDVGGECFGVPNGQWALCSGGSTKFCVFLCQTPERSYICPPMLTCGEVDDKGYAICLP